MKKRKTSIVILALVLVVCMLTAIACQPVASGNNNNANSTEGNGSSVNSGSSSGSSVTSGNSKKLNVLRSELKLTQEQVMSKIKAEYLLENNGYKDDDDVVVIVSLDGNSLVDDYNQTYSSKYLTVADYAASLDGQLRQDNLLRKQSALVDGLMRSGLITGVEYNYTTVMNAVAVNTKYGNVSKIKGVSGVDYAMLSDTFNRPQAISGDASAIVNLVDVYETGIFDSSSVDYTGKGTAVAILDSGFDISHEVFSTMPNKEDMLITDKKVSEILNQTVASSLTRNLELYKVYRNAKVPFAYDYADKDYDVYPHDSEHGTHVAGIIGGKSATITGVAVDTQLVLLKVFPDFDDGGKTEDILAALEDAVLLKVDAINMSLGSSCGFTSEYDNDKLNKVYQSVKDAGISLLTAASNSYSSSFGGEQGNTNFVTNPDSSTVGSPSTYPAAMSVASISGVKSKYLVSDNGKVIFFNESNNISGKANDFFAELYEDLGKERGETLTLDYVIVPGSGLSINYSSVNVEGKIAVVRRGDNSFEEKALIAKNKGAIACIIYNNVDGDILMSMGKTDHIPTISISKDDGVALVEAGDGKFTVAYKNEAGPFMSDFSSWGPTPSLELKPEITAHGGDIYSAVPNGKYDHLSGTSMATPNLCGIVVLIRQYLKNKYPNKSMVEISNLANSMLMSTATIVLNQEGNPYSPRKQGAGLASLKNVVNTNAILSVDGKDRPKIELKDDPNRTGKYVLKFNVENLSGSTLHYDLGLIGMTESVSTSDSKHVSETPQLLNGKSVYAVTGGGSLNGTTLTVNPNGTAKVEITYTLSAADKNTIDSLFPYGMYVEGFVTLTAKDADGVNLNIPFLAFYGDWTQAPMFDKTYYEIQKELYDTSIEDEDKLKADYYATTPYGSYFYNYIIPLGTYLYDVDTSAYDEIAASTDHIAISNTLGALDGISAVYAGLLRSAKEMKFTIVDKTTGEVIWNHVDYNASKAYSLGGDPIPYFDYLRLSSLKLGLINNREYQFKMQGLLDYGDGGIENNVRNSFSFDFTFDNEAPVLKEVWYEKEYDENLRKDRFYINLKVYDNHYVQSIYPIRFTSSSSYTFLTDNPIPVYGQKGQDATVRFEITDFLDDLFADSLITNALAFSIDDYALNSNIFVCQLPGTEGDFKFTRDGDMAGTDLVILSMYEGEIVDINKYLATSDKTVDIDKDYFKQLQWQTSNARVAEVQHGQVKCIKEGRATVTVRELMEGKQAVLIINVKPRPDDYDKGDDVIGDINSATIQRLRFSYYDTVFAYNRAAQTSEIGETGDRRFISASPILSFYPGEKIKLIHSIEPWYSADKYTLHYESSNPDVAIVDENGTVTGLKEGSATIALSVNGSRLRATVSIEIKSSFVIENRTLIAYKGLGGKVVIPDDEGILYIGSYAFCLYDTDNSFELTEDDYDANKIPNGNTTITSVEIPNGVEEIQKYAFYNCTGLTEVKIPDSVKRIREFAFYNDRKLSVINLTGTQVESIGRSAFMNCRALEEIDLSDVYAIAANAFDGCTALKSVDLSALRNTGDRAFRNCTKLTEVTLAKDTKLSYAMFTGSGLTHVDIYTENDEIPSFAFEKCADLQSVVIHNDIEQIGLGAFSDCANLQEVTINGKVNVIGRQAFYNSQKLTSFTMPNNEVTIGNNAFYKCGVLKEIILQPNTVIKQAGATVTKDELSSLENIVPANVNGYIFEDTALQKFTVQNGNKTYTVSADGTMLLTDNGQTVVFAVASITDGALTIDSSVTKISEGAFSGTKITSLTITNPDTVIGDYAFANCKNLLTVNLPANSGVTIGNYAFAGATKLVSVNNLASVKKIGRYAFSSAGLKTAAVGDDAVVGEGAFFRSLLTTVTIGQNASFGLGAFQDAGSLTTVYMPQGGGVYFGKGCFALDAKLKNIDLSKVGEVLADECFYGCSSLTTANLANVKKIGKYAFADCSALITVSVPVAEEIGEAAFGRYEQYSHAPVFKVIQLPSTLKKIGDGAFLGNEGLQEVEIPELITEIPDYAFAFCTALSRVDLPSSVSKIGIYAFAGCTALKDINLGEVERFGEYAFISCSSLTRVNLSNALSIDEAAFCNTSVSGDIVANNLESVGDYAFQKQINSYGLTTSSINSFQAGMLQRIGVGAFEFNQRLTKFTFSILLEKIGVLAFDGCTNLESFYYAIGLVEVNNAVINDYAKLVDGVLYTKMDSGDYELKSVPAGMNSAQLTVAEGTVRIDEYAGNENKHVMYVSLPESLKLIGNFAFYGCTNLSTVEFNSLVAPKLESSYINRAHKEMTEDSPGYEQLHPTVDMFQLELTYYTFIDLVGRHAKINMILPANENVQGYDALHYQVYFGDVKDAARTNYVAMETALTEFIEYAKLISKIEVIKQDDETLINNAIARYNAITQNPVDYGYSDEQITGMITAVRAAKAKVTALKIKNSTKQTRDVQALIDALPSTFTVSRISDLRQVNEAMMSLTQDERDNLDLTKYNALVQAYNEYCEALQNEVTPVVNKINGKALTQAVASVVALAAAAFVAKKVIAK